MSFGSASLVFERVDPNATLPSGDPLVLRSCVNGTVPGGSARMVRTGLKIRSMPANAHLLVTGIADPRHQLVVFPSVFTLDDPDDEVQVCVFYPWRFKYSSAHNVKVGDPIARVSVVTAPPVSVGWSAAHSALLLDAPPPQ
jgi:hypothetical protein